MKKLAFLFPGQGSQFVGMGKIMYENFACARKVFEEAEDALGFDLKKLCFKGSQEELTKTENAQPAILTVSIAALKVYMEEIGLEPAVCTGHSLGEFSALVCAEGMKFKDAVRIVRLRGQLMQEAVPIGVGAMAAITKIDRSIIEEECKKLSTDGKVVVISNYNSPEQYVISGHKDAVTAAIGKLKDMGARAVPLNVSAPFHCPLMQPAADKLKEALEKYSYSPLKYPVISNVTALSYEGHEKIVENLSTQMVKAVRWQESMEYLKKLGIDIAIEIGPQKVLRNLMGKNAPEIKTFAYDYDEDVKDLKVELKTDASAPKYIPTVIMRCLAIAVCTQNHNWNDDEYQNGVVLPYKKIQKMQEELEKSMQEPTVDQMKEALEMLRSVFATKKTPVEEQVERFNQIFSETGMRDLFSDFKMPEA